MCRFTTTRFTKNYNLQGFKELQYVDLQLDLQRTTTWKVVRYFFQSFKYALRTVAILSWFVGSLLFVLYSSGQAATSQALSRLYIVTFSNQEVLRRWTACGSSGENKCSWNRGKIKQLLSWISFQSILYKITKKQIVLLKIVKNSRHKL